VKLQCKAWLCAIILAASALFILPPSANAQTHSAAESLDGQWLTDGYGGFIELQGDTLRRYEITTLSCIALAKATRKTGAINANETVFVDDDGATFRVSPVTSAETRWLHRDGNVSNILLRRTNSRPEPCGKPLSDTPPPRIIKFSGRHSPNNTLSLRCTIWIGRQWIRSFARR